MSPAKCWEVWFRAFDLDKPSQLLGRYEAKPVADKIALVLQTCATEGEAFVVRNDSAPEPS